MPETVIDGDWRDLNATERDILVVLARCGPANARELHNRIRGVRTDAASTRHNLYKLDQCGYIKREQGDGMAKINRLTPEGVAVLRRGVLEPAARIGERDSIREVDEGVRADG